MGTLVRLVVLLAGLYIGYSFLSPRIRAWRFKDSMKQTARLADVTDRRAMRRALLEAADEFGVPLLPHGLTVDTRRGGGVVIRAAWREIVRIDGWRLGEWVDTLRFDYEIEGP